MAICPSSIDTWTRVERSHRSMERIRMVPAPATLKVGLRLCPFMPGVYAAERELDMVIVSPA